ncbi:hypothetical protein JF546_07955 [Nitratireductor aquimarinus]|uniref:hypothetical protein n=1 Tax=Nitratireductor aquimarinus TaxID=889300 RepID=UPI001A8BFE45|nr:hypothetical protein [Nitratireductor aquimarinus]MBN8242939.1 hypothetical protein [Nitratireductor aquimarinus]MBY6132040.1 helix-turn-helix domain-containing protein [Nitratireductor aquimarinus]MCA1301576.1 helix-turn-helix domain-containing protein [Nitratireductor aquimarinus]
MNKSEFVAMLSRRLGVPIARINGLLERLHSAGMVTPIRSKRHPPPIDEPDAVAILLAVLADRGLEHAADNAWTLAAAHHDGERFDAFLAQLLFGPPRYVGHLIVHREGASVVVDAVHIEFGERSEAPTRFVPGGVIMAIAAELQGASQRDADALSAITRILA